MKTVDIKSAIAIGLFGCVWHEGNSGSHKLIMPKVLDNHPKNPSFNKAGGPQNQVWR